jgi:hypothetical protein
MPYVHIHIDLDEFDDDDLIEELESRGYTCTKDSATGLEGLDRVEHLAVCGQLEIARAEALQLVSTAIGRPLQ